ncbi:unnamed protein product [Urochloa humidicola]
MDSPENRDSQPKKPRKSFSIPRRSAGGVSAVASPSSLSATPVATAWRPGAAAPSATPVATTGGPGAAAPSTGGGTSGQPDPSVFWAGMSLDGSSLRISECTKVSRLLATADQGDVFIVCVKSLIVGLYRNCYENYALRNLGLQVMS